MKRPKQTSAKSELSRQKLIKAAGRAFRHRGFGGIGVDGLAQSANLTSGGVYFHFRSKLELFIEAVSKGLDELKVGVEQLQAENGSSWMERFASFYLSHKRTCALEHGCTLPALSSEVERAGDQARAAYEVKLRELIATMEKGLDRGTSLTARERAWATLALLSGGVNMARAVESAPLSEEIAQAVSKATASLLEK